MPSQLKPGQTFADAELTARMGGGLQLGAGALLLVGYGTPTGQVGITGIPAGSFYLNLSGGTGNTLFQFLNGAWTEVTGVSGLTAGITTFSPSLTPAALSATVGAQEQTFTVTGLVAGARVLVNGPAPATNAPLVHARVSAVNTLALAFDNATAAANTPAAGTYLVTQFV